MKLTSIQVESYPGHKDDEIPRRFRMEADWLEVEDVLDRWYQVESLPEWPMANYFKVRANDQRQYLLKHDQESGDWFLGKIW